METILSIIVLALSIGYIYSCLDNFYTWYKYERDIPVEYQRHRDWWRI